MLKSQQPKAHLICGMLQKLICSENELTIKDISQKRFRRRCIFETLGRTIPAGEVTGMSAVNTHTHQGVEIFSRMSYCKVYRADDGDM